MQVSITKMILAAVTTSPNRNVSGVPVFYAETEEEMVEMSVILSVSWKRLPMIWATCIHNS